jgi:tripartite-type tricarboxylate transporter receptor subunit TctC
MYVRRRRTFLVAASALLAAPLGRAQAAFPSRPIRIVVGFAPGGATDAAARLIGEHMARLAGQAVIVENRIGAGGIVAAAAVARAAPDGHTLLLGGSDALMSAQGLFSSLPYDPNRDFAFVTPVVGGNVLLCVHRSVPAANLRELVEHARRMPALAIGSWARGSQGHLVVEVLNRHYGLEFTHVVYKGEGPMSQDLIGGQIAGGTGSLLSMIGAARSGYIRPIALTNGPRGNRCVALPEVATFAEQGLDHPAVTLSGWVGMLAPAGTPRASIALLNRWVRIALEQPEVRAKLEAYGLEVISSTPEAFEASFRAEAPKWVRMIEDAGVRLD